MARTARNGNDPAAPVAPPAVSAPSPAAPAAASAPSPAAKRARDDEAAVEVGVEAIDVVVKVKQEHKRVRFTAAEDDAIVHGLAKHKTEAAKWRAILDDGELNTAFLDARTNVHLKDRWRTIKIKPALLDEIKARLPEDMRGAVDANSAELTAPNRMKRGEGKRAKEVAAEKAEAAAAAAKSPGGAAAASRKTAKSGTVIGPEDFKLFKEATVALGGMTAEDHMEIASDGWCRRVRDDPRFGHAWWAQKNSVMRQMWNHLQGKGDSTPPQPVKRKRAPVAVAAPAAAASSSAAAAAYSSSSASAAASAASASSSSAGASSGSAEEPDYKMVLTGELGEKKCKAKGSYAFETVYEVARTTWPEVPEVMLLHDGNIIEPMSLVRDNGLDHRTSTKISVVFKKPSRNV